MKKILIVGAMLASLGAYAQGTLNFNNIVPASSIDAPVFNVDGTTKLFGAGFQAQLLAGPNAASLASTGPSVPFRGTTALSAAAGYFSGGEQIVAGVAPGTGATIQVRAWEGIAGSTFAAATKKGSSGILTGILTGGGSPPAPAGNLVGLTSFSLVPEPSTIALGALGALALLFRRRK